MFATGVASSKLHREEMQRAEYLATVNRQKNKELEIALDRKTQELKETELKFISAFEVSPAGIWIAAAEGNLEYVNAAYRNQANLQTGTDLERWVDTVHPEDKARVIKEFETCMDRKVISEFRFLTDEKEEDGTAKIRWVTATGMPRFYDPDTVTGVRKLAFTTGAIMDITARKEAEIYQRRRADDALAMRRQLEDFIDFVRSTFSKQTRLVSC
jgi:PAS domain S-box-containing protein